MLVPLHVGHSSQMRNTVVSSVPAAGYGKRHRFRPVSHAHASAPIYSGAAHLAYQQTIDERN